MTDSWSDRGSAAIDAGDLQMAKQCFTRAVKADSTSSRHRFHLAIVLERLGEIDAAAQQLTQSLRLDPKSVDSARRLASLFRRAGVDIFEGVQLDTIGLRNGLNHNRID